MMHWKSLDDFLAMGGYGFYVWVSYGLTAACLALELWMLWGRKQRSMSGEEA